MRPRPELFFLLLCSTAIAQGPQWQSAVPPVQQSGVHAIVLAPELVGRSQHDLADLRLVDSTGVEVPFVLRMAQAGPVSTRFVPYTLLRNEVLPKRTEVELERPSDRLLNELHIWIRPADVQKSVRITGSDDREQWYMVKDEHLVTQGARGDPPHQMLSIQIPRSDYRFFRISLNDSLTAPMRILGVGHFAETALPARYTRANVEWTQRDSARITLLRMHSAHPIPIERICYSVQDSSLFHRYGRLLAPHTYTVRKGRHERTEERMETVSSFTLSSDLERCFPLNGGHEERFELEIDNADDRPLHFTNVAVYQVERMILANLEPGMRYRLTTGSPEAHAPDYDLARFADRLAAPLDTLDLGSLERIPEEAPAKPVFDPSRWWIWALIVALMAAMGWMAMRMLRSEK